MEALRNTQPWCATRLRKKLGHATQIIQVECSSHKRHFVILRRARLLPDEGPERAARSPRVVCEGNNARLARILIGSALLIGERK
jgi:hypothetical protein